MFSLAPPPVDFFQEANMCIFICMVFNLSRTITHFWCKKPHLSFSMCWRTGEVVHFAVLRHLKMKKRKILRMQSMKKPNHKNRQPLNKKTNQ